MLDYKKMYDKMAYELEDLFKKPMTPTSVAIMDDITAAMRNIKKMEYWDSPEGRKENEYRKQKHSMGYTKESKSESYAQPIATIEEPKPKKKTTAYGFYDDYEEYVTAKEHYNRCRENGDMPGMELWKEVCVGNLKSALAQLDMTLQGLVSGTDTEEERIAIKDMIKRLKDRI